MRALGGQWIEFRLGQTRCAIPILSAKEIIKPPEIVPLPGMPEHALGIIDLRGRIIPVVDLAARFGRAPPSPTARRRIIVAAVAGQLVGFHVHEVTRILRLDDAQIGQVPANLAPDGAGTVQSVAHTPDGLVLLWNLDRVLSLEEIGALRSLPGK